MFSLAQAFNAWGLGHYLEPRRKESVSKVEDATGFSRVEIQLEPNLIAER